MASGVTGLPYGALLTRSKSRWSSLGETGLNVIYPAVCHGIIFLFFVLLSLVCFVSVNYLVLMYCRIES